MSRTQKVGGAASCPGSRGGLRGPIPGLRDLRGREQASATGTWQLPRFLSSLPLTLAVFTSSLARGFAACVSRWCEALWLPPESQMDSFCGGRAVREGAKKYPC